jgi:ABC-2 type transport system permease protein
LSTPFVGGINVIERPAHDGDTTVVTTVSPAGDGRGVHNLGYRRWSGRLAPGWARWTVITNVGIRRAWQNKWLKRLLLASWLPVIWFASGFFIWEQAAVQTDWRQMVVSLQHGLPPDPVLDRIKEAVLSGKLETVRHTVWAWLLKTFIRYPQLIVMVLVVGLIAPPLISQDIRSRAFLIYFSRPLTRTEYVLGKMAILWAYLAMISTIPGMTLYVVGVLSSPHLNVVNATWDLPLRIVGASVILMLPTSALALCFSSLTQESRNAGFAWFAVWILGWFTYAAASSGETFQAQQDFHRHQHIVIPHESGWTHLSLYHTLGRVQNWVFGFTQLKDAVLSMVILAILTLISLVVLYRRISAPMRV